MSKKLLTRTTNTFLLYSIIILLISAPLFYYITDRLYVEEADETLKLFSEEFRTEKLPQFKVNEIADWNKYNRNIRILPWNGHNREELLDTVYYDTLEDEHEPYRELTTPIIIEGRKYTYSARVNLIEKRDMVKSTAVLFSVLISILLCGVLLIAKILAKRLWKPFYHTLDQIEDFEIDKGRKREFGPTGIVEFDRLNRSLHDLIQKNTEIYNRQREFIENAAHELQTPLALFQVKVDSLLQLDITKDQAEVLGTLNDDIARLNRLNRNLLLLSKIGNEAGFEKQPVVINEYLEKNLDFFIEQGKAKDIDIKLESKGTVTVASAPALVEVLVNNLFLNAIQHNVEGGTISVFLTPGSLVFRNTGSEKAIDSDRLFNRFAKGDPSSSGNGLGLAIIHKITEINHWKVSYSFIDGCHEFTIRFNPKKHIVQN